MKILFILLIIACRENHPQKNSNSFKDILLHKKCLSISQILIDDSIKINNNDNIIYLYHGLDCYLCIKRGFEIASRIDSISHRQKVFIVGIATNIGQEQSSFRYYNYIYKDNSDLIRKELKYLPTPIMLLINSDKKIIDVVQPGNSSEEDVEDFIRKINLKKSDFFIL